MGWKIPGTEIDTGLGGSDKSGNLAKLGGVLTGYNPDTGNFAPPDWQAYQNVNGELGRIFNPGQAGTPGQTKESAINQHNEQEAAKQQADLRKAQGDFADDLQSEGSINDSFSLFRNQVMRDLASSQKSLGASLNRRGLGSGGIARGASEKQKNLAKEDLASGRLKIRDEADAKAQEIRNNLMNQGFRIQQTRQQMLDSIYQSALDSYLQKRRAFKAIGQAGGTILGTYLGGPAGGAAGSYAGGEVMG